METPTRAQPVLSWFGRPSKGRLLVAMLTIAAVGYGAYLFINRTQVPTSAGPPGWTIYHDPTSGWTLEFPNGWHVQGIKDYLDQHHDAAAYGVLTTNVDRRVPKLSPGVGTFDFRGMPATLVAVKVSRGLGGPWGPPIPCTDTPTPLTLSKASRTTTATGAGGTLQLHLEMSFIARNRSYGIEAWIGSQAAEVDRERLDRIVASISFEDVDRATLEDGGGCSLSVADPY